MITKIPLDWEAVSAYLDDQLNPKDRRQLEIRLQTEPELQAALESLRRTRLILRSTPKLRAPRNFTLTASMAGIRERNRIPGVFPLLRLASMLAAFFLVLLTAGSLTVRLFQPAPVVVMQSEFDSARPAGLFGKGGGGGSEPAVSGPLPTEAEIAANKGLEADTPIGAAVAITPLAPLPEAKSAESFQSMAAPEETTVMDNALVAEAPQTVPPEVQREIRPNRATAWSYIAILQILLAALAVITGLMAFYFRRDSLN